MSNEARYFSVLSAAVAKVESDSFEARGVVYDRLWQLILQQLESEADASDERIATERIAFLAAIKRIEFGERAPLPDTETYETKTYDFKTREFEPYGFEEPPKRRTVGGRILLRMAGACLLLLLIGVIVLIAYPDLISRQASNSDGTSSQSYVARAVTAFKRLTTWPPATQESAPQRAVFYEENATIATGSTFSGRAFWKELRKPKVADVAVSIDVEIPDKNLFLEILVNRSPEAKGVISHVIEFKFFTAERQLSEAVRDVLGILMKTDELSAGTELVGQVVPVQPGVFLMGLSGADADISKNMNLLRERSWLDIPIVFRNGVRGLLAVEKGATGQNAINELLRANASG